MKPAPIAWSLVGVILLGGTLARGQSLSDLAKKEEERRKAVKAPTKVYTNDDLKKYPTSPPAGAPAEGQPATAPGAPPPVPAPTDQPPADASKAAPQDELKDEAYWKDLLGAARTKLERDESYLEALQTRINSLTNDFYARDDPAQRAALWSQRTKALDEMERLKKDVVADKAAIAKIQDDARRAGVPPGWLR
jgi:hypothetical protein